jgi:hypothetical protein
VVAFAQPVKSRLSSFGNDQAAAGYLADVEADIRLVRIGRGVRSRLNLETEIRVSVVQPSKSERQQVQSTTNCCGLSRQKVRLITRRSKVQILSPHPNKTPLIQRVGGVFVFLRPT